MNSIETLFELIKNMVDGILNYDLTKIPVEVFIVVLIIISIVRKIYSSRKSNLQPQKFQLQISTVYLFLLNNSTIYHILLR